MPFTTRQRFAAAQKRFKPALFAFTRPPAPTSILDGFSPSFPTLTQFYAGQAAGPPYDPADFQAIGSSWLIEHPVGVLGDDMGLGKCKMTCDAVMHLCMPGYHLIVCEASNVDTWMDEWAKWYPDISTFAHRGMKREAAFREFTKYQPAVPAIVIVSYATFRNDYELLAANMYYAWAILDEGQTIRGTPINANQSLIAQRVHSITAPRRHILTGTPISKTPADCWNLMRWLGIEHMSWTEFAEKCLSIKEVAITQYTKMKVIDSYTGFGSAHLRKELAENMVRRLRADVLQLPPLMQHDVDVRMNGAEAYEYKQLDAMYTAATAKVSNMLDHGPDDDENGPSGPPISPRAIQGAMLQQCQEIKAKFDKTEQLVKEAMDAERKVIVFCTRLSTLRVLYKRLGKYGMTFINGKVKTTAAQGARSERQKHIDKFQNDSKCRVLIATQQSCRVGVTLTAASVVIRLAREWNPDQNDQAIARMQRAGQTSIMDVYDLYAVLPNGESTMEKTHVLSTLKAKSKDAESIIKDKTRGESPD